MASVAEANFVVAEDGCVHVPFELLMEDAVAVFDRCRSLSPVVKAGPSYLVISGPHVIELLSSPRLMQFEGEMMTMRGQPGTGPMADFTHNTVLLSNGDVHRRRRAPLMRALARPIMERLRASVKDEAQTLARALPRGEPFDFLEWFAAPFPARIITGVAGLNPDHWQRFARNIYVMTAALAPPFDPERWPEVENAAQDFTDLIAAAIDDRRANPREDFITEFVMSADEAGELSELEIRSQMLGLIFAGSDTTRGGLTSIMGLLMAHRDQWEEVKADRSLLTGAVNEGLRLDPPVGGGPRFSAEDIELDGAFIPKGSPVEVNTLSAMHDEALYANPKVFDIHRTDGPRLHPVFGGGKHRCAGEYFARMELEEAILAIMDEHPDIELAQPREPARGYTAVREPQPLWLRIP